MLPLCPSFKLCGCQGPTHQLQEEAGRSPQHRYRQEASACLPRLPPPLSDCQELQPSSCTYLGWNHVISKNQIVCHISLQGHGDRVESARGRHSESNAHRVGDKAPTQHGISAPPAAQVGVGVGVGRWMGSDGDIWRQDLGSISSSPLPAVSLRLLTSCY